MSDIYQEVDNRKNPADLSDSERRELVEQLLTPVREALLMSENPVALQQRLLTVLDNCNRYFESYQQSLEADRQAALRQENSFVERALQLLEQHYGDSEFGVESFCQSIGMSRSLAGKRLRTELGVSVGTFIRSYRLRIAREMLLNNHHRRNITEIAYNVGFNDPKYFTRCFTRAFGISPSAFYEQQSGSFREP